MRNFWLILAFLWITGLPVRSAATPEAPAKGPNEVFVAVLSHFDSPDAVEQNLRLYLGSLPGIDYLIEPDSPDELFEMLEKLTRDGKKIRYLVIAGHGNAKAPNIKFRSNSLRASDVDIPPIQKRLTQTMDLNQRENLHYDHPDDETARLDMDLFVDTLRPNYRPVHKKLDDVSDAMADGGEILLLNCSAAATDEGKRMCRNLGQVLLGKGGGTVIASTVDVQIDQAWAWFSILGSPRTGKWVTSGDVWVSGQWLRIDIPAKLDPFLFVAFHPTSLKTARAGQTLEISPEVDARIDSGKLLYSWNGGAPSDRPRYTLVVKDNPQHRMDIKVRVQDEKGRVGEDTFTVRIEGVEILGGDRTKPGVALPLKSSVIPPRQGLTYKWSSGGRTLGSEASLQFLEKAAGRYPVSLEVSDKSGLVGTDSRTIVVEEEKVNLPTAEVDKTTVVVSPLQIMASDFFELACQLPARLQDKVTRFEWLVRVGSGEGVPKTSETARVQIQLLREWVGSNFGVRLYNAKGHEVDVIWANYKSFTTRKAEFSLSHPSTWQLTRREGGSLFLKKEPTLVVRDSLKESEGEATYSGDVGGGILKVDWLSGDELRGLTEGGDLPRDWTLKGDIKQKGAVAFRVKFEPTGGLWPNTGGPLGSKLATRLAKKYEAAVTAHRQHTARQAQEILASLTVTPGGEVTVLPDPGPPKVEVASAATPTPSEPGPKSQAAEKIRQANEALGKGQIEQSVTFAQQAGQLDAAGCKQDLVSLATEMKKRGWDAGHVQEFATARTALQGALQLNPGDSDARTKLEKVIRAEKAWPRVQALGQQVDELVQQRRLITAYPVLRQMISLANDLLYRGVDMHPYADGVSRRYHARNHEWNKLYQATSEANRVRFQNFEYQAVLDSIGALEAWELSEANRIGVDSLRQSAQRGLAQQAQAWSTYIELKARYDGELLDRTQTLAGIDELRGALRAFNPRDERSLKVMALIAELDASLKRESLTAVADPAQQTCKWGQLIQTQVRARGGTPPYRYEWLREGQPSGVTEAATTWKFDSPGRYLLTAVVTDARNKVVRATSVVVIEPPPPLQVRVDPAQLNLKLGETCQTAVEVSGGTPPYQIQWLNEGHPTGQTQATNTWRFPSPGRYVLTAMVTDARNTVVRGTTVVTVAPGPALQVRLEPAEIRCKLGQEVLIEARASGGNPPYRYSWLDENRPMATVLPANNWKFASPGRYVVTGIVTDASNNQTQSTTVVVVEPVTTGAVTPPVRVTSPSGGGKTTSGTSYAPNCKGDPFQGGSWNSARGGSDWLQHDFATPRSVSEIRIEAAGTDVTTDGSSIEILLHTPGGSWVRVDRLENTNINLAKLTGGRTGNSIPTYAKVLPNPVMADAVRINLSGNGWFVARNIQVLSGRSSAPPQAPVESPGIEVVATFSNESGQNVHIFTQGESFGPQNRLAPGEKRQIRLRMRPDGRIRFVCGRNGQVLATATWNGDPDNPNRYPRVTFTRNETLVVVTGLR